MVDRSAMGAPEHVFAGCLTDLPDKESSTVRIFLSSTFTDMQAERNWLMKYAIPHLRKFCQERGFDFQIADMRWGVREDATDDHKTTELCINAIKNCQSVSRGPNFVAFLGDKYGFRPLPAEIVASEFKLLKNTIMKLGHDTSLLLSWYQCDNNKEPSVYILQPISLLFPHYFDFSPANAGQRQQAQRDWLGVVDKLSLNLRQAADVLLKEGKLTQDAHHRYFQSVTESEVHHGILSADNIKDTVVCFQRSLIDVDFKDEVAGRFIDMIDNTLDMEAEELREHLRLVKLPRVMPPDRLYRYNLPWDEVGVNIYRNEEHIRYMEQFGRDFISSIENMVDTDLTKSQGSKGKSPLFNEVLHHLHFCRLKCETFCGRENMLEEIKKKLSFVYEQNDEEGSLQNGSQDNVAKEAGSDVHEIQREHDQIGDVLQATGVTFIRAYSADDIDSDPNFNVRDRITKLPEITEHTKPVIVYGASGSGKTAIMAKVMELANDWFPDSVRIIRFLGTSTMSTNIREVVFSLCQQIWQTYKIQKPVGVDLESDFQLLVNYFAALLWDINTGDQTLMILLDSVDQLSPADHAHSFNWIPHKLPPSVHFLISMVTDRNNCLKNIRQVLPQLQQYVEVTALEGNVAADMINALCKKANHNLSKRQRNMLLDKFAACSQPLYLKLLVDMALSWKSYTVVDKVAIGVTIKEAINHLFDNLEKSHGALIIQKGIGFLCAAREGLTDAEIEDLLSLDDQVLQDTYIYHLPPDPDVIRLPPLLWKRVEYDISEYMVERESGGKKVVTWYHRQFWETANERYLTETVKKDIHHKMAEYFQGIWSDTFKPLELTKGKKGTYPNAMRQVPAQPIRFSEKIYNTRKLSELPFHLVHSEQFETLLVDVFGNPEWLYAKCQTMSLTGLMEDLRLAENNCGERLTEMKTKSGNDDVGIKHDTEVCEGIKQVTRMVLLTSDSVRKDPTYLPLQILCQLGPAYKGNVYIEQLMTRCQQWCVDSPTPLLVPLRACMVKPGGHLLYTIDIDHALMGEKRDPYYHGLYLREDINQLFIVRQQSAKMDQICVLDIHDNGSCITTEDINMYICSIKFVGKNKYLLLDIYTTKDEYSPVYEHRLYESSTATPVKLPHPHKLIEVSSSGKYVAYSSGSLVTVCRGDKHMHNYYKITDNSADVTSLFISPDETLLLTSDVQDTLFGSSEDKNIMIFDLSLKKLLHRVDNSVSVKQRVSLITNENLLLCQGAGYQESGKLIVYDMVKGEKRGEVSISEDYAIEQIRMHSSHQYVLVGHHGTGVINGKNAKYAELCKVSTCKRFGLSPVNGPYKSIEVFGKDSLFYSLCPWNRSQVYLLYAGSVTSPLPEAVVIHILSGHNQPIGQTLVPTKMDIILTASKDNTVKVWDLQSILGEFASQMAKIKTSLVSDAEPAEVMSKFRMPEPENTVETSHLALNRFGDNLYVATNSGDLRVYETKSGDHKMTLNLDLGAIRHMMLSQSGRFMIVAGKHIHVEDLQSQQPVRLEPRGKISCMAESNNILVAGSCGMQALGRVWNIQTGEVLKDFELLYSFYCVAINSSGTSVVSSMFDFPIVVHLDDNDQSMMDPNKMDTMMNGATCCCISPNDKLAACGSADGAVRVIDMVNGKYMFRIQQKSSAVAVTFTVDGKSIVSTGYRSIYVCSTKNGSLRYKLTRHQGFVNDIKFDETGRYFVTISQDKQLILWDFKRSISIATFHAQCQITSMDVAANAATIAYVPKGIADVAILKPNKMLSGVIEGKVKTVSLTAQSQALALAFTGQRSSTRKSSSAACSLM